MFSKKMENALNKQVALEAMASQYYLAMAGWCDAKGFNGMAAFLYAQAEEERAHMLKIFHYIHEMDGVAITPPLKAPKMDYKSVPEVFKTMLKHEQQVSKAIYNLVSLAQKEDDQATYNFLQWYVTEQREEEAQAKEILDTIKIMGVPNTLTGNIALYHFDQAMAQRAASDTGGSIA